MGFLVLSLSEIHLLPLTEHWWVRMQNPSTSVGLRVYGTIWSSLPFSTLSTGTLSFSQDEENNGTFMFPEFHLEDVHCLTPLLSEGSLKNYILFSSLLQKKKFFGLQWVSPFNLKNKLVFRRYLFFLEQEPFWKPYFQDVSWCSFSVPSPLHSSPSNWTWYWDLCG